MERFNLLFILTIVIITSLSLSCGSSWKTIDDPKWGFKVDLPASLQDKEFEGKYLWVHEDAQMRVIVDFGRSRSQAELRRKNNYSETSLRVDGYNAIICTYNEREDPQKRQFENVATLIFQESPQSYGEGKPPVFRVEYGSEKDFETAMQILQTVRFYETPVS